MHTETGGGGGGGRSIQAPQEIYDNNDLADDIFDTDLYPTMTKKEFDQFCWSDNEGELKVFLTKTTSPPPQISDVLEHRKMTCIPHKQSFSELRK